VDVSFLEGHSVDASRTDGLLLLETLVITMDLDPFEENDYEDRFDEEEFAIVDIGAVALALFDPQELVVRNPSKAFNSDDLPSYRISSSAAIAISAWTRLRTIRLEDLDLVWHDEENSSFTEGFCFLGLGGTVPISSTNILFQWLITSRSTCVPSYIWTVLDRDQTLFLPAILATIILVEDQETAEETESILNMAEHAPPPSLRVVIAKNPSSSS